MEHVSLEVRKTRKYVGAYQHLDDWETIGSGIVLARGVIDHNAEQPEDGEYDPCEPLTETYFVKVQVDDVQPMERVIGALCDSYTNSGCAHEYDCCGCRNYHANAKYVGDGIYCVEVGSSRNY